MLAGMLKAPSKYNPFNDPRRGEDRASLVIRSMVEAGYLSDRRIQPRHRTTRAPI